jgi:hypothetical protein
MTTAADVIADALLVGQVGDQYNPLDPATLATGMRFLNRMAEQWSAEVNPLFNIIDGFTGAPTPGFVLTPPQAVYTLGPANLLGVRPTMIAELYLVDGNNVSYFCEPITADEYARLIYKVAPGRPNRYYANYNADTVVLTFYPTPAYADNCHVMYFDLMQTFGTNSSTLLHFPPGYEEAIIYNLALRLAPIMGGKIDAETAQRAAWTKGIIKEANVNTYMLKNPTPTQRRRFFNILTGDTN